MGGPTVAPVISGGGRHLPIADLLGIDDYEIVDQGEIRYYLRRDEDGNPFKTAFVAEQKGFNGPIRFLLVLDAEQKKLSQSESWSTARIRAWVN